MVGSCRRRRAGLLSRRVHARNADFQPQPRSTFARGLQAPKHTPHLTGLERKSCFEEDLDLGGFFEGVIGARANGARAEFCIQRQR